MKVEICGTEDGEQVAWVSINKNGTVTFLNREGDTFSCILGNGLKIPSTCSADNELTSPVLPSKYKSSQSPLLTSVDESTSRIYLTDRSSAKESRTTATNNQIIAATSIRQSAYETPLTDESLIPTPEPACTCCDITGII